MSISLLFKFDNTSIRHKTLDFEFC